MQTDHVVIRRGADVVGPEGPLGQVEHVVVDEATREISEFVVRRPDGSEWVVPGAAVACAHDGTVALRTGWPDLSSMTRQYSAEEYDTLSGSDAVHAAVPLASERDTGTAAPAPTPRTSGTLQLREEELNVRKHTQELGTIDLRKEVVSERQSVDVPVWHEELIVERQSIDPPRLCDERVGENRSIKVVLREEVADVDKDPVVSEVVRAGRRTVEERQHIEANARREVADLRTEGDIRLREPDDLGRQE